MSWFDAKEHNRWLSYKMQSLLEFGHNSLVPAGFGFLDGSGEVDDKQPCWLYITARKTYVYSIGSLLGIPQCRKYCAHGIKALSDYFYDEENGGWFEAVQIQLDADGNAIVADGYGDKRGFATFCVLQAAAAATIANRPGAHELLKKAVEDQEKYWWDEEQGMVHSKWNRDYSQCDPYNGLVSPLHAAEAYLAVSDALHDVTWLDRAVRMLERVSHIAEANYWRIPEHYDEQWNPIPDYNIDNKDDYERPYGITVGHAFELTHLVLLARAMLEDTRREVPDWMLTMATEIFERARVDSWKRDGKPGFIQTIDFNGEPVDTNRQLWVPLQAIQATVSLFRTTQNMNGRSGDLEHYEHCYHSWLDYVAETIFEPTGLTHYHPIGHSEHKRPPKGHEGIYHAFQTMLSPRLPLAPTTAAAISHGKLDDPKWRPSLKKEKKKWFTFG